MSRETDVLAGYSADGGTLFVRPLSPCNAKIAGMIKQQLPALIRPKTAVVVFDLSDVAAADSTFIGLLLMLRRRSADAHPDLRLAGVTAPVSRALDLMHLLPLFEFCEPAPEDLAGWTRLNGEALAADQLAEIVLRAHESIVEADARNAAEFGRVIEGFQSTRPAKASEPE